LWSKALRFILLYDAGCGPCTRFKNAIEFLDIHRKILAMSLIEGDRIGLLKEVPPNLRHRSFHLISPTGAVLSGAKALPQLIGLLPAGGMTSGFIVGAPGGLAMAAFIYTAFSRLHGSGSCSYVPGKDARPDSQFGIREGLVERLSSASYPRCLFFPGIRGPEWRID
jgi:predicted DCC family thiol-disulfide oxidoreductase YuxK